MGLCSHPIRAWAPPEAASLADRRLGGPEKLPWEWQKPGALCRERDCLLAEASVQDRGPDLEHAVGAPR